jgi:hypothetical protein
VLRRGAVQLVHQVADRQGGSLQRGSLRGVAVAGADRRSCLRTS